MEDNNSEIVTQTPKWHSCVHCPNLLFKLSSEFERHVESKHSLKEGSIILCQYGNNGLCPALQFGDLRRPGFKYHLREYHMYIKNNDSEDWTFYSSSQNLPAVLNDPNRGKQTNFFTKTWGDSFVEKVGVNRSPYLPEITLAHFEGYCKKLAKRYHRHIKFKENVPAKDKSPTIETTCEIPIIFYEQSLQLNDPVVFTKVFPNLCNSQDPNAAVRSLQDTLSTYLDIIEMKISKQVAQKSDAFFHAMLSHDTIMEDMATAVKTVQLTRQTLSNVKVSLTQHPLDLISITRVNKNMSNVHEILKLMGTVQQTQPMIQLLLGTSDYVAALDLIGSTQKVLATRLLGVQAFRHLSPQLTEMKRLIHKMLNDEFQRFVGTDLSRPPTDKTDMPEKGKLVSVVSGILRIKELDFIDTFKVVAMTSIQATIKQSVIEIISEREGNSEIVLRGSNSDSMSLICDEGILFLRQITPNIMNLFKRIVSVNNLILEISQMEDVTGTDSDDVWTSTEMGVLEERLKKLLASLSDYCNERCANLIVTKTDKDNAFTDLSQLSTLSHLIENFSRENEEITGHASNAMKLALKSYAMKFIQNLHINRRLQLTTSLNAERWKPANIPCELQSAFDQICSCNEIPLVLNYKSDRPDAKFLTINKESFTVVATVQLLVKILLEYCEAIKHSPVITQYIVHCMLELIRLYNSRCCQLVLGAGAIQSAGLKTISTSNLALVSRSLQVVLWLLTHVKQLLQNLNLTDFSLNGFDSVESDMNSHKQEIESKICLIVSNMLSSQLTGWDAKPPVPSQTFRNISKHLVKLHEALVDILPNEQIQKIYKNVHENFKAKLKEQLNKMNIIANGSPQHGVVTSELTFYLQTLKTLRIINENDVEDNILYDIWLS